MPGSILKIENENYDAAEKRRQLWCWAISSKRYTLHHPNQGHLPSGQVKVSEHGLGHLLNPTGQPGKAWIEAAYAWLYAKDNAQAGPEPDWLDLPAISRLAISTPTVLAWFDIVNRDKPWAEQVKPANFMLVATADPYTHPKVVPIAPYNSNAADWLRLDWIDRATGHQITVTTQASDGMAGHQVRLRTYRNVLAECLAHPETKSLAPGGAPVRRRTRGLLQRRPVTAGALTDYIGKEGNRIEDRTHRLVGPEEHQTRYPTPAGVEARRLLERLLIGRSIADVARLTGIHRRTIERVRSRVARPHQETLRRLRRLHSETDNRPPTQGHN